MFNVFFAFRIYIIHIQTYYIAVDVLTAEDIAKYRYAWLPLNVTVPFHCFSSRLKAMDPRQHLAHIFVDCISDWKYSWLSLSRPRLSRIIAYLEMKILSLTKHENLTTGKKMWKKEKLLLRSNFSSFPQYFHYISNFKSPFTNIFVNYFFPEFCKSDMSRYRYLEVFQRVPWNSG